jgi:hypothetical protein
MKKIMFGLLALLLGGCVSTYVEPVGEERAPVEFVNDSPLPMGHLIYRGAAECTDRAGIGKLLAPGERRIVYVTAKEETAFEVSQDISHTLGVSGAIPEVFTGCVATISFQADMTKKYSFSLRQANGACSFSFTETGSDGQVGPVAYEKREWIRALSESGPFCKPKRR